MANNSNNIYIILSGFSFLFACSFALQIRLFSDIGLLQQCAAFLHLSYPVCYYATFSCLFVFSSVLCGLFFWRYRVLNSVDEVKCDEAKNTVPAVLMRPGSPVPVPRLPNSLSVGAMPRSHKNDFQRVE